MYCYYYGLESYGGFIMNCEVYNRFKDVVPVMRLDEMDAVEVGKSCKTAFSIIGYSPKNLDESIEKAWESSTALSLFEFIYDVYEVDCDES